MSLDIEGVLDRYEAPLYRGAQASPPAVSAHGTNPRCGDVVTMYVRFDGERVAQATFEGSGCTISQAAADLTAELAQNLARPAVLALALDDVLDRLGRDVVRTRLDCAGLALHTLHRALALG